MLKDDIHNLKEEDKKLMEEIIFLKRKIESLTTNMFNMKGGEDTGHHSSKQINIDFGKYVEFNTFNEFKQSTNTEIEALKAKIDQLRKMIDEIINLLDSKLSKDDLKRLEEYLLSKIEELKIASSKKFADKNDIAKAIRHLEQQIKHLLDIKKVDKGENWLLAKKPITGYSCASCEAYIGDLQDNMEYIAWNKYPMRDPSEKLYRVFIFYSDWKWIF